MSILVEGALRAAALDDIAAARRAGRVDRSCEARLRRADLLAVGALADRVRADEIGEDVVIHTDAPDEDGILTFPQAGSEATGLELLREIAIARITGPRAAHLRVDWTRAGLEIAQIALGFGADQLAGRLASKRGLPLADDEKLGVGKRSRLELASVIKRRELEGFVRSAGRRPVFAGEAS